MDKDFLKQGFNPTNMEHTRETTEKVIKTADELQKEKQNVQKKQEQMNRDNTHSNDPMIKTDNTDAQLKNNPNKSK